MLSGTLCKSSDALWHRQQQCEKSRDDHFQPTSHGANPSKIPPGGGEVIDLLQLQLQVVELQEDRRRDQERIHLLECYLSARSPSLVRLLLSCRHRVASRAIQPTCSAMLLSPQRVASRALPSIRSAMLHGRHRVASHALPPTRSAMLHGHHRMA